MAFLWYNLTLINRVAPPDNLDPQNGFWNYKTADTLATVLGAGYFDASTGIAVGDEFLVFASDGMAHLQVSADARGTGGHLSVVRLGTRFVGGQAVTVTAQDTIATGGTQVIACGASLNDAPALTCMWASASPGDQNGAPAKGSIYLNTWKPTANNDVTPIAATAFGKNVSWWALVDG